MLKSKKLLALLSLALTLGINSCSDNCVTDSANGGNASGDVTEQNYQKYETLQNLLGVVASVDSLPQNWDTNEYTAEPTLGVVKDASNPYVRYVVTASAEEADREFRSMISQGTDGTAKSSTWNQDGVGSLDFKVLNESDCYATLDVNVQQLPHLTQLRFVPASVIGENKIIDPYYQFGDVVMQNISDKQTYWVCVRPCDKSGKLGKSHWCSLQLVPQSAADNANYKKISDNLYLPTDLGSSKGDAQRMVQNFFNVLRIMANPDLYNQDNVVKEKQVGIDNISYEDFTYAQAKKASSEWTYYGIWDRVGNSTSQINVLKALGSQTPTALRAYYYGYNSVWVGKGDYKTHYLDLSNDQSKGKLFNVATPQTELVYTNSPIDYKSFETDGISSITENGALVEKPVFIVKYRTGAQLGGGWSDDKTPETGFGGKNGIADLIVSNKDEEVSIETPKHFFSYGDIVNKSVLSSGASQFCIKPSYMMPNSTGVDNNHLSIFLAPEASTEDLVQRLYLSNKCIAAILYQLAAQYAYLQEIDFPDFEEQNGDAAEVIVNKRKFEGYVQYLSTFISNDYYKGSYDVKSNALSVKAYLYPMGSYEFVCYPGTDKNPVLRKLSGVDPNLKILPLLATEDITNTDKFSKDSSPIFRFTGDERTVVTNYINQVINEVLAKLEEK